ncbi:MAG: mediator of RNA polymerase II transcription subunit 9 [Candidatus Micrarchaeota archaeon]|nr:mediator of RNA polymerase II transcription subunit 9 [Candidatus Micrarchaeota archaeon]
MLPGDTNTQKYIVIGIAAISLLLAFSSNNVLLLIITAISTVLAALMLFFGDQTFPFLAKMKNVVIVMNQTKHEIPPTMDVVIKQIGNTYYASRFFGLKLYEAFSDNPEGVMNLKKQFEQVVINYKKPFKISYLMYAIDISAKKKELETKRSEIALRLQKARESPSPDLLTIERLEREKAYWNQQIQKLEQGLRPMDIMIYCQVVAMGNTKDEVIQKSRNEMDELKAQLQTALRAETYEIKGPDLLKVLEMEYVIPATTEEMYKEIGKFTPKQG